MVNLNSILADWRAKLKSGDTEFAMIARLEDAWCLVCDRDVELIISLKIFRQLY